MYLEYWKLTEPPFENVPNPRFVFYSANHDEALMRLLYTVNSRKGACMMTGEVGCGKTTISKVFQERLNQEGCNVALLTNPNLSSTELLQDVLHHLGGEHQGKSKVELLHSLHDLMRDNLRAGRETVVLIDEAHLITSDEAIEELRLLLNFQESDRFLLTLILVGQPELKSVIHGKPQFEQRIAIKHHLKPLSFVDTCKYIQFRLQTAGANRQLLTADAAKRIYQHTEGVPRKINNLCDMCLLSGFIDRLGMIDHNCVDRVIKEES